MKKLTFAALISAGILFNTVALANDSNYDLILVNNTPRTLTVESLSEGCADWSNPPNFPITVQPFSSMKPINFFRASRCSGKNGQVNLNVKETLWLPNLKSVNEFNIFTDFSTKGTMTVQLGNPFIDSDNQSFFEPYVTNDTSRVVITVANKDEIELGNVFQDGCFTGKEVTSVVKNLSHYSQAGSLTLRASDRFIDTDRFATKLLVTKPIWGFRSPTFSPKEITAFEQGYLLSKFDRKYKYDAEWDDDNKIDGPNLSVDSSAIAGMRYLAVASSDEPKSQLVSVALDFSTAASFRKEALGPYVYAFRLVPNSPIIGLKECNLTSGGEIQIQPLRGTNIWYLMRPIDGKSWETFLNDEWIATTTIPLNPIIP